MAQLCEDFDEEVSYPVKCISPEWMVKFHSGYELDENDYHDISVLCERFGIVPFARPD